MNTNGNWRSQITIAMWIIALSSHLILMPMLIYELYEEFFRGKKHENRLFK